jgi:hypothetical protein
MTKKLEPFEVDGLLYSFTVEKTAVMLMTPPSELEEK